MENDGTIPKREVVTLSDPEDNVLDEVQCPNPKESFSKNEQFWRSELNWNWNLCYLVSELLELPKH